jgi:hypothetical protein
MSNKLFVILLSIGYAASLIWAFRTLPREKWQIFAAVPRTKDPTGRWQGLNLTYYGLFMATSNTLAAVILIVLLGAIGIPPLKVFMLMAVILGLCWPASRIIARLVEKKNHTFTVGGALFVGVMTTPWIIESINAALGGSDGKRFPAIPTLAATAVAYAYAEGLGRLSCISFGCCYGKPIAELSPRLSRLFKSAHFVFTGATKKAAYEGHLEGTRVVPVQALTAVTATLTALTGTYLYLESRFTAALIMVMATTQTWRVLSEALRADFRGPGRSFSTYQVMALCLILYLILIVDLFDAVALPTQLPAGLAALWDPAVLLLCQALWSIIFLATGRSMVTGSTLTFFVHRDRI